MRFSTALISQEPEAAEAPALHVEGILAAGGQVPPSLVPDAPLPDWLRRSQEARWYAYSSQWRCRGEQRA